MLEIILFVSLTGLTIYIIRWIVNQIRWQQEKEKYENSSFYKKTGTPFHHVVFDKGVAGEYDVSSSLETAAGSSSCTLYNLYLPTNNNRTTEIDAVMISPSGVFVIESKNYSGWIFGNANQKYWCQTLPSSDGCEKHRFYNPIWQNGTHIRCLRQLIKKDIPFYSIIVFADKCTLKKVSVENAEANVIYASELPFLVQRIQNIEGVRLNGEEIVEIYNELQPYSHVNDAVKLQHIQQLWQKR